MNKIQMEIYIQTIQVCFQRCSHIFGLAHFSPDFLITQIRLVKLILITWVYLISFLVYCIVFPLIFKETLIHKACLDAIFVSVRVCVCVTAGVSMMQLLLFLWPFVTTPQPVGTMRTDRRPFERS